MCFNQEDELPVENKTYWESGLESDSGSFVYENCVTLAKVTPPSLRFLNCEMGVVPSLA